MCQHRTARGLHACKRVPQVRAVVMCQHHIARGSKYERKYELLVCVGIIQRESCMRANKYRRYELFACVSIIQRGLHTRGRVPVRAQVRGKVRAVGMHRHHTARGSKYERRYDLQVVFDAEDQRVVERCLAVIVLGAQFPSYRIWVLVYRIQYSVGALKRDGGWV